MSARPAISGAPSPPGSGAESGSDPAEQVLALLRAHGGRATATRRAVIEVLLAEGSHRHLSAEDVAAEVRRQRPEVAESSIYRTLGVLEELGLVSHLHLGHGPSTFHLSGQPHRHLVCQRCQATLEIPSSEFDGLARRLDEAYAFLLSAEHFALRGLCRQCRDRHD